MHECVHVCIYFKYIDVCRVEVRVDVNIKERAQTHRLTQETVYNNEWYLLTGYRSSTVFYKFSWTRRGSALNGTWHNHVQILWYFI